MNRRGFLRLFGLGAAAFALDPERLLWVPGQKTIIDLGGIVEPDEVCLTVDVITREALKIFQRQLLVSVEFNRHYDEEFAVATMPRLR